MLLYIFTIWIMWESINKIKRTIYNKDAPFSNLSVWLVSLLLWPIPGWICTYISLKNLWYKVLARNSLVIIFILSFIVYYFMTIYISDKDMIFWISILIWIISMIINLLLQAKHLNKWKNENLDNKLKSWYIALVLWIISYIIVYLLSYFFLINNDSIKFKWLSTKDNKILIEACNSNLLQSEADELNLVFNKDYSINNWCSLEKIWGWWVKDIPNWLYKLINLKELRLTFWLAENLSKDIWKLKNLEMLFLFQWHFKELPEEIIELKNLKKLILSWNWLKKIPDVVYKLEWLEELYLWMNEIEIVSQEIWNLKNLTVLDLEDNNFNIFPSELINLKNLKEFHFKNNDKLSPLNKSYSLEEKNNEAKWNIKIMFNEQSQKVEIIIIEN